MSTGFITEWGGSGQRDLDTLFHPGTTGTNTGFLSSSGYRGLDLGLCFDPLDAGSRLPHNTGFVAYDGRDLADWFCAAGTRVADWPVGGGFFLFQNGNQHFVFNPDVNALAARMAWTVNSNGTDAAYGSNLMADRATGCPGTPVPNVGTWQDFGGYQRGITRRLPIGSVIRFEFLTINLAGVATWEMNVVAGEQIPGWIATHSGAPLFCSFASPFLDDSPNLFDFSPPPGAWYGAFCPYLTVTGSKNWSLSVAATFCCNLSSGTLNEQRVYITRIA